MGYTISDYDSGIVSAVTDAHADSKGKRMCFDLILVNTLYTCTCRRGFMTTMEILSKRQLCVLYKHYNIMWKILFEKSLDKMMTEGLVFSPKVHTHEQSFIDKDHTRQLYGSVKLY